MIGYRNVCVILTKNLIQSKLFWLQNYTDKVFYRLEWNIPQHQLNIKVM